MFTGEIQQAHEFRVALLDASGTYDPTDTELGDVDGDELPDGDGYDEGGVTITISASSNTDATQFTLSDAVWANATFTARHAVVYDADTERLLLHVDLGEDIETEGGDFKLEVLSPPEIRLPAIN